ncbi:MAG: helix-turn-helix domain-containing protein [Eggerthellaceae bacterium]
MISYLLNVPEGTVRQWPDTYRSVGMGALTAMGTKKTAYSFEVKVAAARAVADEGMTVPEAMAEFGIASASPLGKWLKAYREGGPEALRPEPKGRPKGAKAASKETTREQELERRIQKLVAEYAYLKTMALKAEKHSEPRESGGRERARALPFLTCWEAAHSHRYYYALSHPKARPAPSSDAVGASSRESNGCRRR